MLVSTAVKPYKAICSLSQKCDQLFTYAPILNY